MSVTHSPKNKDLSPDEEKDECAICLNNVGTEEELISCSSCGAQAHTACVSVSQRLLRGSKDYVCAKCKNADLKAKMGSSGKKGSATKMVENAGCGGETPKINTQLEILKSLQASVKDLKKDLKSSNLEINNKLNEVTSTLKVEMEGVKIELSELKKENVELKGSLTFYRDSFAKAQTRMEVIENDRKDISARLEALESLCAKKDSEKLSEKLLEYEQKLVSLKKQIGRGVDGKKAVDLEKRWEDLDAKLQQYICTSDQKLEKVSAAVGKGTSICKLLNTPDEVYQRDRRLNNLTIDGIPGDALDIEAVVNKIAVKIGFELATGSIEKYMRFKDVKEDGSPAVLIKFKDREVRDAFLVYYLKKKNLKLADLELPNYDIDSRIYINEHLSPAAGMVMRKCAELKRKKLLAGCYTKAGRIYVRSLNGERISISCEEDLDGFRI